MMFRRPSLKTFPLLLALMAAAGCSTTKVLQEGEYRLAKNKIEVTNSKSFNTSNLTSYIKQQPNSTVIFGWSPGVWIYNLSSKDGSKGKFWRKIGTPPVIYNAALVDASARNIESHLTYLGYYNSKVNSKVDVNGKEVSVTYDVTLGKRYLIDSVQFFLPDREEFINDFMADTSAITIHKGSYLSESDLENETARSAGVLKNKGYFTLSKNNYSFVADTLKTPGHALLEMHVKEYTRNESSDNAHPLSKFHFRDVKVSMPADMKFKDKIIKDLNTIVPGDRYSDYSVNTTYSRLSALKCFNGVSITTTQVDSSQVDCNISMSRAHTQGFKVNFETSTNSSGLMGISPQISFYNRNMFNSGVWLNLGFMGNFQFKLNDNTRAVEAGFSSSLSFPRFVGLANSKFRGPNVPRTEINFSYNYQDRPEYTRGIFSTSYGYTWSNANKYFFQVYPLQINMVSVYHLDDSFNDMLQRNPFLRYTYQKHLDAGVGGTLYHTTNAAVNPSTSYSYERLSLDFSGNIISIFNKVLPTDEDGHRLVLGVPYSQFVRLELTLGRTLRFGYNDMQAIAGRLIAGAGNAYGNSTTMPFEKQFYAGGASSMRAWQARALGPGSSQISTTFSIPSQTGNVKLEADLEYRFPLFWKFEGALFAEAGNVWTVDASTLLSDDSISDFSFKTLGQTIAADWGTGLRVNLDFLVLRVDIGFKLKDPSRDSQWLSIPQMFTSDGFAFHFGVGYPF